VEVKTVYEGAGNRIYNAAERQTVRYRHTGLSYWTFILDWIGGLLVYAKPVTALLPACILFRCFAGDGWRGIGYY